ncbi:MAG: DUF2461 domain-containing protein [Bacteroidetes bacterium]|nr:DUF2461 domain-containing protein [Bacteroidota bacterium]MDA1121837.1 DUF2461 domain-containing protein [Bacteroidota bacterium]
MKKTFQYLKQLKSNNNKEWFNNNRLLYEGSYAEVLELGQHVIDHMNEHDNIETVSVKKSIFRIYRDVRFSKDKTPYKTNWGGFMRRSTAKLRGGYYYQIEPGNSYVAGGFFNPNSQDLLHIRKQISQYSEPLREILNSQKFIEYFGQLHGEQLKTSPRGFEKNNPDLDLLRYKRFILRHHFSDREALNKDFAITIVNGFKQMRPFFDYMSDILTTDLNGVTLLSED